MNYALHVYRLQSGCKGSQGFKKTELETGADEMNSDREFLKKQSETTGSQGHRIEWSYRCKVRGGRCGSG